eukprot:8211258-Pyramimonas_sp.AAC.1
MPAHTGRAGDRPWKPQWVQKPSLGIMHFGYNSLPRLCLEGFLLGLLKGLGSATRPGRFPQYPPRGSHSYVRLA